MFGKRIDLLRIFGFEIRIDPSWVIIAILIAWSLSAGLFPFRYEGLSTGTYWIMGIVGAIGLFFSIIVHEMSHSLVARRFGISIQGITLFIFGGVAEMKEEPRDPKAEFMMAVAGPVSSILLAAIFYGMSQIGKGAGLPEAVYGVILYLAWINGVLAAFNLIPAFPLDGGRVLRSILWGWKGNLRWATRISAAIGSGFGLLLVFLGVVPVLRRQFHRRDVVVFHRHVPPAGGRGVLPATAGSEGPGGRTGEPIHEEGPRHGPALRDGRGDRGTLHLSIPLQDASHRRRFGPSYRMRHDETGERDPEGGMGPENGGGHGRGLFAGKHVAPETDAMEALSLMNRTGSSRLMVLEGDRLAGVISLKDLLKFLELKVELEPRG
jgi:Zn-dependent protease